MVTLTGSVSNLGLSKRWAWVLLMQLGKLENLGQLVHQMVIAGPGMETGDWNQDFQYLYII